MLTNLKRVAKYYLARRVYSGLCIASAFQYAVKIFIYIFKFYFILNNKIVISMEIFLDE